MLKALVWASESRSKNSEAVHDRPSLQAKSRHLIGGGAVGNKNLHAVLPSILAIVAQKQHDRAVGGADDYLAFGFTLKRNDQTFSGFMAGSRTVNVYSAGVRNDEGSSTLNVSPAGGAAALSCSTTAFESILRKFHCSVPEDSGNSASSSRNAPSLSTGT